ncbi:hypothetical protein Barb7_02019 [Bacteroidales bacterium Barb7]|nr:hypothetical protein Barb7_02019 [Bacteroidales bacterium Barb7]
MSSCNRALRIVFPPTVASCVTYPIYEKARTAVRPDTVTEYFPLMSVIVPVVVPFSETFTPTSVSPETSVTIPLTVIPPVCAVTSDQAGENINKPTAQRKTAA